MVTLSVCKNNNTTKIAGFLICGIGRGHLSQAKTIYDIMIDSISIPIIIITGIEGGYDNIFNKSKVIYKIELTTPKSIQDMEEFKVAIDFFTPKFTLFYEYQYQINLWINFWQIDLYNPYTKQICIGEQYNCNHSGIDLGVRLAKNLCNISIYSLMEKNRFSTNYLGPLINSNECDRSNIDHNLVLAYSISGIDFINTLNIISRNHTNFKFNLFIDYKSDIKVDKLNNNIKIYDTNNKIFKQFLDKSSCVLCTTGNELIQECVNSKIPVATMPCATSHFEQVSNYNNYVSTLKYAESMYDNMNLIEIIKKDMSTIYIDFKKRLKDRDIKIRQLIFN